MMLGDQKPRFPHGPSFTWAGFASIGLMFFGSYVGWCAHAIEEMDDRPSRPDRQFYVLNTGPGFASRSTLFPIREGLASITFRYAYPIGDLPCRVSVNNAFFNIAPHGQQRIGMTRPPGSYFPVTTTFYMLDGFGHSVPCGGETIQIATAFLDSAQPVCLVGNCRFLRIASRGEAER